MSTLEGRWDHLSLSFGEPVLFSEHEALVWYDGPQAIIGTLDGQRILGVLADEGDVDGIDRWVCGVITREEEAAIRKGTMPLRDVLQRESAMVIDIDWHKSPLPARIARVDGRLLDDDNLPAMGLTLVRVTL